MVLNAGNFAHAFFVAATLEGRIHKYIHHFLCFRRGNKASGNAKYVGIVMLPGQGSNFCLPANGGSYTLVFVGCNSNTITAAADQDTCFRFTLFNGTGNWMGKIRVIH